MSRHEHFLRGNRALGKAAREELLGDHTNATIWALKALVHFTAAGTLPFKSEAA